MPDAEERRVPVGDVALRCRVEGRAGAPWVVFSNSLLTDLTLWDAQVAALAGRCRTLRYDQRGHGGSDVPPDPCTFDRLADDLAALMDAFGIEQAAVVGVSMGAATVLNLAIRHPGRVARLMACDGQARSPASNQAAWEERIALARAEGMARLAVATVRRWFTAESITTGHPAVARVQAMIERTRFDGFVAGARALQSFDLTAGLSGIMQPAVLLAGAEDGVLPAVLRDLAGTLPAATFVEIAGAGHLPMVEREPAFNAALERFLGEWI